MPLPPCSVTVVEIAVRIRDGPLLSLASNQQPMGENDKTCVVLGDGIVVICRGYTRHLAEGRERVMRVRTARHLTENETAIAFSSFLAFIL